jgi:hypothetical protein
LENNQLVPRTACSSTSSPSATKVDSPGCDQTAGQRLAISLLKNNRGEIDLNLPISGSLDDPQFSIGGWSSRSSSTCSSRR